MIQQYVKGMNNFAMTTRNVHRELKETLPKTYNLLSQYMKLKNHGPRDTVQTSSKLYKKAEANNADIQRPINEAMSDGALMSTLAIIQEQLVVQKNQSTS